MKEKKKLTSYLTPREAVKTVTAVLLFLSMILLNTELAVMMEKEQTSAESQLDMASLLFLKEGADADEDSITSLLCTLPAFFGYHLEDVTRGFYGNQSLMRYLYSSLGETFRSYFGASASGRVYEKTEGEALWLRCTRGETYVYLKYHQPLLLPILAAYLTGETALLTDPSDQSILSVQEIFFVRFEGEERLRCFVRAGDGTVAEYKADPEQSISFDISRLSAYNNNKGFYRFTFGDQREASQSVLTPTDTTVILRDPFYASSLQVGQPPDFTALGEEAMAPLAEAFQYNTDLSSTYTDGNLRVYMSKQGRLEFSSAGTIQYQGSGREEGIPLYEYLGYQNYSGQYSLDETLKACAALTSDVIRILKTQWYWENLSVCLSQVNYDGTGMTVSFRLLYDNLGVTDPGGKPVPFAVFYVYGNAIHTAWLGIPALRTGGGKFLTVSPAFTLARLSDISVGLKDVTAVMPLYVLPEQETEAQEPRTIYAVFGCYTGQSLRK